MTVLTFLGYFLALAGLTAVGVYIFGIPPEMKRKMERQALKTMGENKASYVIKDQISKVPDSDQRDVKELKRNVGNLAGGLAQNPVGEFTGETADSLTSPFTGR